MSVRFDPVEEALADLRQGRMAIVCDGAGREGEGDLVVAAELVTPAAINFMAREGRGLICLALHPERCDQLGLRPITRPYEALRETVFTVSIEAREGVTTGISAHDRARTVRTAVDPERGAADLVEPGHVLPVRTRPGGVLERPGQAEAAIDLVRLAGLRPAAVLCGVLDGDGRMARTGDLAGFAARHGVKLIAVSDLVAYRREAEAEGEPAPGWRRQAALERAA